MWWAPEMVEELLKVGTMYTDDKECLFQQSPSGREIWATAWDDTQLSPQGGAVPRTDHVQTTLLRISVGYAGTDRRLTEGSTSK